VVVLIVAAAGLSSAYLIPGGWSGGTFVCYVGLCWSDLCKALAFHIPFKETATRSAVSGVSSRTLNSPRRESNSLETNSSEAPEP
jgi:hypothetical protein